VEYIADDRKQTSLDAYYQSLSSVRGQPCRCEFRDS